MVSLNRIIALGSLLIQLSSAATLDTQQILKSEPEGYFNWSSITPSKHMKWHRCYEFQECARLEVLMDPKDTSLHEIVAVAVIRDPVNISRSDPSYGGSIFLNPGGPGGSGVNFLRWAGYEIHHKIEDPKHFDLVSWDPRGVGQTTPVPSCFDNELDRQLYWLQQDAIGMVDESDYALQYNFQAAKAFGRSCNSTILRYMTTLSAVQDLLAIADALEPDVKEPLVNYWGLSYGTLLGNTLASVYPHRVGKTILDGVVGSQDYMSNLSRGALVDTDRVLAKFYETCHIVGPSKCPLYESTPRLVRTKVDALLASLRTSPIAVSDTIFPHRTATLLTSGTLRNTMFSALFYPHLLFEFLATALHGLTQSPPNTTLIRHLIPTLSDPHDPTDLTIIRPTNNSWDNSIPPDSSRSYVDSSRIIACTDQDPLHNWTTQNLTSYISDLHSLSPLFAGPFAATTITCTGWTDSNRPPAHVRFTGPFGSNLSDYDLQRGARPILFIGNEADPVCPFAAAGEESAKHEGSVVLKTDIFGHVSVPINPSRCVWDVVRRYWNFGELPREGMMCKGDWDAERWEMREPGRGEEDMVQCSEGSRA